MFHRILVFFIALSTLLIVGTVPRSAAAEGCYAYPYMPYLAPPYDSTHGISFGSGFQHCEHYTIRLETRLQELGLDDVWHTVSGSTHVYHSSNSRATRTFLYTVGSDSCYWLQDYQGTMPFRTKIKLWFATLPYQGVLAYQDYWTSDVGWMPRECLSR